MNKCLLIILSLCFSSLLINASRKNIYVQSADLNVRHFNSYRFPAKELLKGGKLKVAMGLEPNKNLDIEK